MVENGIFQGVASKKNALVLGKKCTHTLLSRIGPGSSSDLNSKCFSNFVINFETVQSQ